MDALSCEKEGATQSPCKQQGGQSPTSWLASLPWVHILSVISLQAAAVSSTCLQTCGHMS